MAHAPRTQAHAARVVPELVALLGKLPAVWAAPHHGGPHIQSDATQLMVAMRRWGHVIRCDTMV
jgi:hypothetical protein